MALIGSSVRVEEPDALLIVARVNSEVARAARRGEYLESVFVGPFEGGYCAQLEFRVGDKRIA